MATSAINHHSHWNTTADTAPQQSNRSEAAARGVYSPWAQIGQSESNIQVVHFSDCSLSEQVDGCAFESDTNSNGAKKTVWNKPSNGAADVSPVMGALSWPALSDSTKASFKSSSSSSSSDSLRTLSNGSVSETQVTGMASASHRQANTNNANPNTMLNHVVPSRQRSMKRGGGNSNHNASANGVFSQQQAHGFEVETVNNSGKSGNYGTEFSSRDNNRRDGGQWGGFGAQSHGGNDHQHQRNANRRGNVGPHPRGDGTYHNGYGGRRDQERQNQDWKPHRGWGNRDAHMQPQRGPARPFMGAPPHTSPPYIPGPMPVQPYQPPMVYSEVPPVFYFPGPFPDPLRMPMLSPVPPVFVHVPDTQLQIRIVNQMDYYFSNENLIKDTFLRQNMDEHGWVPVTLIAGFKKWRRMINLSGLSGRWTEKSVDILLDQRFFSIIQYNLTYMHAFSILSVVMELTDNIQLILNAVRSSTVVEVQGEKLRRRNDWFHWLMPPSVQNSTVSSPQSLPKSTSDILVENLQRVAFDDKTVTHGNVEARLSRSSSAELNTPSN